MPLPGTAFTVELFGGLDLNSGTEIADSAASVLQNLYWINGGSELYRRAGQSALTALLSPSTADLDYLGWAQFAGSSTDYVVASHAGSVLNLLGTSPYVITSGDTRFTSGSPANGALVVNLLCIGNGYDANVATDGTYVRQLLPDVPTSGMAATYRLGPNVFLGTYYWQVAFVSYDGFVTQPSGPMPATGVTAADILTNASGFTLTNIPLAPAGQDCTAREIYRTVNGGGDTYYLVGMISDNTTTTFVDTTLDAVAALNATLDDTVRRTPPCQVLIPHQERLAGILCHTAEGDTRTLYLSSYQNPSNTPIIPLLSEVSDPTFGARIILPDVPTALASYGNVLIIFYRGMAYRLRGDNPNNWALDHWIEHGCVSHRTVRTYKNALLWLGPDGVYQAEGSPAGTTVNRISDHLKPVMDGLTAGQMAAAHAQVWYDRYYLFVAGSGFYYDLTYRTWGQYTPAAFSLSTVSQNIGTKREAFYASPSGATQLLMLETGSTDSGTAIPVAWASKDLGLRGLGGYFRLQRMRALFKAGTGSGTVNVYKDTGDLIQSFSFDLAITPSGGSVTAVDKRFNAKARGRYFRFEVQYAGTGTEFRLLSIGAQTTAVI